MAINTLKIVQHNILHWRTNYLSIVNTLRTIDPDIILINSHGNNNNKIKIFNYNIIQINSTGEVSDGSAICIKRSIPYKEIETANPDVLAISVPLHHENIIVSTFYSPPRKENLPTQDIIRLLNYNSPTIIAGDMNAHSQTFADNSTNKKRTSAGNNQ